MSQPSPLSPGLDIGRTLAGRPTATQRVVQILKRFMVSQELTEGMRLPAERRLAETLNVSRTVLREAISQLIGEGLLVRTSPRILHVAAFEPLELSKQIAPVDVEEAELRHLIDLRVVIELGAIDLIVHRASDDDLAGIERLVVEGERRAASGLPIELADARFHAALLKTLRNPAIDSLLPLIDEHLRQNIALHPQRLLAGDAAADQLVAREHRRVFEALRARDGAAARAATEEHLRSYVVEPWPVGDEGLSPVPGGSAP